MRLSARLALLLLVSDTAYAVTDKDADGVRDLKDACPQTPKGLLVHANGCSKVPLSQLCLPKLKGESFPQGCQPISWLKVFFAKSSTDLAPSQWPALAEIAHFLRTYPEIKLLLIGHTDTTGTDEFNMALSFARAQKVRDILIQDYHILPTRLESKGKGREMAKKSQKNNKIQHADNRNVEFLVR